MDEKDLFRELDAEYAKATELMRRINANPAGAQPLAGEMWDVVNAMLRAVQRHFARSSSPPIE